MPQKLTYIISNIDKALAFEWIARHIDKKKYTLSFLLINPGDSNLERFLKNNGIEVRRIVCGSKKDWPSAWWSIYSYLRKSKPDIVHCHLLQANILGLTAAKYAGITKRIYTRHHSDYHFRYFPKGVKWDKLANKMATHIVAPTNAVKYILKAREGVSEEKISVINHGFDLDYFKNVPESQKAELQLKYNPDNKRPIIGVVARFTQLKGIQYIIPAFGQLLSEYPNALLLLFNARGDYEYQLRIQLKTLPEHSYKTIVFEPELAAVYSLFDVFIQASTDTYIEAFGQTYVEALAAGVPSVFTLSGVAPDFIIDKENALVVPFCDADSIYNSIVSIIKNKELSHNLIKNGYLSVQNKFRLETMISELENLYNNATTN
ncbi:MAG: glycosyltransferase family 4 protein [Limnohabitans sp.]|nr:glycosyltransferase family 4 protein [Limnohabitans sp.]